MRSLFSWLALIVLSASANAGDCDKLLIPDFNLPGLDTTTDLAYLAAVTPENFAAHKNNAFPRLRHVGILLPIASHLLRYSKTYDEFSGGRAQKYTELGFDYPQADLAAYYQRLLPKPRFDAYASCTGASGFTAQVVRADRDFVHVMASWRQAQGGPAQVSIKGIAATGGTLATVAPKTLQAEPAELVFIRNRNADLRWSADAGGHPVGVWVPRFVAPDRSSFRGAPASCAAGPDDVVSALYRQLLERAPKAAERSKESALLKTGTNTVGQLAARIVLGGEYEKKFARGKALDDVLSGLYGHVLARVPDEKGFKSNQAQFRDAAFSTIALAFFENSEYENRFGEWNVPGDPSPLRYCADEK